MNTCDDCLAQIEDWETYGDIGDTLCFGCFVGRCDVESTWYGLGPHHHDLNRTGSIIGSTVFDPLPEQKPDGSYEISPGLFFWPDHDDPRMGLWT